jgi:calcineurin-like phosphoesterase family protein
MTTWFTSDTHFSHKNIISYCKRPFDSVYHMDSEIIRRWNERVQPDDTVIHLGDFGLFRDKPTRELYLNQLNGYITILGGNHNDMDSVVQSLVVKYGGIDWWCAHYPSFTYTYNLCGHVHNNWLIQRSGDRVCVNCGVDVWDFYPVGIQEVLKVINAK